MWLCKPKHGDLSNYHEDIVQTNTPFFRKNDDRPLELFLFPSIKYSDQSKLKMSCRFTSNWISIRSICSGSSSMLATLVVSQLFTCVSGDQPQPNGQMKSIEHKILSLTFFRIERTGGLCTLPLIRNHKQEQGAQWHPIHSGVWLLQTQSFGFQECTSHVDLVVLALLRGT